MFKTLENKQESPLPPFASNFRLIVPVKEQTARDNVIKLFSA